jgi:hypothetical protein
MLATVVTAKTSAISAYAHIIRSRRQRHRERGGSDQHQDPGCVRARLGIHVGVEDPGDQEGDGGEHQHQRAGGQRPRRRHPVAGQVAGDQVEQARHGRGAGEPQDRDGADVVGGAEPVAQVQVRQVGQGPAVGAPPGWNSRAGISTAVAKLEVSSSTAMIAAATDSSRRVPAIRRASL